MENTKNSGGGERRSKANKLKKVANVAQKLHKGEQSSTSAIPFSAEEALESKEVQSLRDEVMKLQRKYEDLQFQFQAKCGECKHFEKKCNVVKAQHKSMEEKLKDRERLIRNSNYVIVSKKSGIGESAKGILIPKKNTRDLGSGESSLNIRLEKLAKGKQKMILEIRNLRDKTAQLKSRSSDFLDTSLQKEIAEAKTKLKKATKEKKSLKVNLALLEVESFRLNNKKFAAEQTEKELNAEQMKLFMAYQINLDQLNEMELSHQHFERSLSERGEEVCLTSSVSGIESVNNI